MTQLFARQKRAAFVTTSAARIAFCGQASKMHPVMIIAGFAAAAQAHAITDPDPSGAVMVERATSVEVQHDGISLDEAVSRAESQYHARVVRTDVVDEDGRKVYVLKLLSDGGRVFTVRIDAATGRMR
jgi:uncharacterized membrane protein YkoI